MQVTFRGNKDELLQLMRQLPAILSGKVADPLGIAHGLQLRLGMSLLSKVQQAYIIKARGGRGADGITWAPLKPASVKRRRKKGVGGVEILRDTSRMLRSLSPGVDGPGPEGVLQAPPGQVIIGTNVPYASYHHHGTRYLPARPLWPAQLPPAWWQSLLDSYRRGLMVALVEIIKREG